MTDLAKRKLGRTGLEVTTLGYGAMELRGAPRGPELEDEDADRLLNGVLDAGINLIDTSIDYGRSDGSRDSDPHALYEQVAGELSQRKLAYVHLIEPVSTPTHEQLAPSVRRAFAGPLILCGGFDRASAQAVLAEQRADLIAFGVGFIANPDLVARLQVNAPWNAPDPATFYSGGDRGYIDYPFLTSEPDHTALRPNAGSHAVRAEPHSA